MAANKRRKKIRKKSLHDNNREHQSEFSAEVADPGMLEESQVAVHSSGTRTLAWLALISSIASLFLLPQLFGLMGIVLGGAAWFAGARSMGVWSIVIGAVSLIAYIAIVPYYA